ncbi:hypothetical protein GCM10010300_76850 [Streptomyces olivaceoviridis]|nr:hypothetical protein GCM10010300_76850 [Streptomyces olivaceoviridis]
MQQTAFRCQVPDRLIEYDLNRGNADAASLLAMAGRRRGPASCAPTREQPWRHLCSGLGRARTAVIGPS